MSSLANVRGSHGPAAARTLVLLLLSVVTVATPLRAQSHTRSWVGVSVGVFDGFGIGLTHWAHVGPIGVRATVATGTTWNPYYGVYSGYDRSRYGDYRYGGYRYGRRGYDRYDDYCWDRAWDLRWGQGYYGGWDWGFPTYDHLDFYHDCLGGGIDYAYDRWYAHARRDWYARPWGRGWCEWSCGGGVTVAIYVRDPFWSPWGPYWAYDPWGWYWDGFRAGRAWGGYGWGYYGGVVYSPRIVRTAWVENGRGWTRTSPLAAPRFKEDPTDRRALPRGGRVVQAGEASDQAGGLGERPGSALRRGGAGREGVDARPSAEGRRIGTGRDEGARVARLRGGAEGDQPTVRAPERGAEGRGSAAPRARPTDVMRGRDRSGDPQEPAARAPRDRSGEPREPAARSPRDEPRIGPRDEPRAQPRVRGGEGRGEGGYEQLRRRPTDGRTYGDESRYAPPVRSRGGERGYERPTPSARSRGEDRGYERPEPSARARGEAPRYERPEPRMRPRDDDRGYERPAPSARSRREDRGYERPGPSVRSGGGGDERRAPAVRSNGGERSAPAPRSGSAPRRR